MLAVERAHMSECKHGLKSGCAYCHGPGLRDVRRPVPRARTSRVSRLSEQMNERMTALRKRLRQLRGE